MANYLSFDQITVTDFEPHTIEQMYNKGYVFTRLGKGIMQQTRSARIDLEKFELSSENRRIQKKTEHLTLQKITLPFQNYTWHIGKMAKDFYDIRNAEFSANKIKELLTDKDKSNFTTLLIYNDETLSSPKEDETALGYCIAYETEDIIHYSYPFYDSDSKDTGLGMIIKAVVAAKNENKKYFYLGSLQRSSDTYKLQFSGFEWFDEKEWSDDVKEAKERLRFN